MKTAIKLAAFAVLAVFFVGCASRTSSLVTADLVFRHGTNEVKIKQPKDVSFDDLMVSPSDGTVRIKKYRSTANEAAVSAAEKQAEAQIATFGLALQSARDAADAYLRLQGIPVPPRAPMNTIQAPPFQFSPTNTVTK